MELGLDDRATFSLFVRHLPPGWNFLIACGLDDLLSALETLKFADEDLTALAAQGVPPNVLGKLERLRFEGDVQALPEGTPFFANEPILEITASFAQGQLVEALTLSVIGFQTAVASRAARIVEAAEGRTVIDVSAWGTEGVDVVPKSARAAFVGGIQASANILASTASGMPVRALLGHGFVQAMPSELDAFRAFARRTPNPVLTVDTYDPMRGVRNAVTVARELRDESPVAAIRIDSGDLLDLSRRARNLLDGAGLGNVQIVAGGNLDEHAIEALLSRGAPIDSFAFSGGPGAAPAAPLDLAYELAEFGGEGRIRSLAGKRTLPCKKQVFRTFIEGSAYSDMIGLLGEPADGEPLLVPVMLNGRRTAEPEPLATIRARCAAEVARLPSDLRSLNPSESPYAVEISAALLEQERIARGRFMKSSSGPD